MSLQYRFLPWWQIAIRESLESVSILLHGAVAASRCFEDEFVHAALLASETEASGVTGLVGDRIVHADADPFELAIVLVVSSGVVVSIEYASDEEGEESRTDALATSILANRHVADPQRVVAGAISVEGRRCEDGSACAVGAGVVLAATVFTVASSVDLLAGDRDSLPSGPKVARVGEALVIQVEPGPVAGPAEQLVVHVSTSSRVVVCAAFVILRGPLRLRRQPCGGRYDSSRTSRPYDDRSIARGRRVALMRVAVAAVVVLLFGTIVVGGAVVLGPVGGDAADGNQETDDVASGGDTVDSRSELTELWSTNTRTSLDGNHHRAAPVTVDGDPHVAVPLNGEDEDCRVVVLDAGGEERGSYDVPPADCHVHAVGDLAVGTFPGNEQSVLVATGEEQVLALDAASGDEQFRHDLPEFGYSPPAVLNSTPQTLVVADFLGTVVGVDADGQERWRRDVDAYVWNRPVRTAGPNGAERVVVGGGSSGEFGVVRAFDADGTTAWSVDRDRAVYDLAQTRIDGDPAIVAAERDGSITAVDAHDGSIEWERSVEDSARVATSANGVYVTDRSGTVSRLDPATGTPTWERTIDVSEAAPLPIELAALTGEERTPVVVTADGQVIALTPKAGSVLGTHRIDASLYAAPTAADLTDDGREEIAVVADDGRTLVLSYSGD